MRTIKIIAISVFLLGLSGCSSDDDDCETGVSGCPSSWYSCPAAANCYSTSSGCGASGECD